jgi:hypothetical protein
MRRGCRTASPSRPPARSAGRLFEAVVSGDGNGKPLGFMNSPALVTVGKESGQAASTIVTANVLKMYERVCCEMGGTPMWLANSDTIPQLGQLTIGNVPAWLPNNQPFAARPTAACSSASMMNFNEHMQTLGTLGRHRALVDLSGYALATKQGGGIDFAASIHLFFDQNLTAFRWILPPAASPICRRRSRRRRAATPSRTSSRCRLANGRRYGAPANGDRASLLLVAGRFFSTATSNPSERGTDVPDLQSQAVPARRVVGVIAPSRKSPAPSPRAGSMPPPSTTTWPWCRLGVLGASATVDAKLQQATDNSGTGVKDVTGKAITQLVKATQRQQPGPDRPQAGRSRLRQRLQVVSGCR